MGVPAELIKRTHDEGILWIQTVGDLEAARAAIDAGADVLIAQGTEAGGNAGWIATSVLVPMVVDVAGDIPVVAAGGIGDGRGIAAALALGAEGASLGTRFLATTEMEIAQSWKDRIVGADALDAVKFSNSEKVMPPFNIPQVGVPFAPRSLRSPLIEQLERDPDSVVPSEVVPKVVQALKAGGGEDLIPFTGQSAGLVRDIVPAADLVARLVAEAEQALRRSSAAIRT
jgi:nitronate monooxygenase/enoyl-[acyl-carrier protein] reductase II